MIRQTYLSCPQIPHIIPKVETPHVWGQYTLKHPLKWPQQLKQSLLSRVESWDGSVWKHFKDIENHCWTKNGGASLENFVALLFGLVPNGLFVELRAMKMDKWIMNLLSLKDSITVTPLFSLGTSKGHLEPRLKLNLMSANWKLYLVCWSVLSPEKSDLPTFTGPVPIIQNW